MAAGGQPVQRIYRSFLDPADVYFGLERSHLLRADMAEWRRTVVSAAVMTDLPPMVKWTAAVIAGGGIAGVTQGVTAMLRANSTVLTGGLGNLVIATAELGGALLVSLLALAAPLAALALVLLFLWLAIRLIRPLFRGAPPPSGQR
jgi:hypothetical protein